MWRKVLDRSMKHDQDFGCGSPRRGRSILLVEDEFLIRMAVAEDLRADGYRVVEAASGEEACSVLLSGTEVDIVVSDVRMPGSMDGLGLLRFIRSHFARLPVVLCSGHLSPADAEGAVAFLSKPYTTDALSGIIECEAAAA